MAPFTRHAITHAGFIVVRRPALKEAPLAPRRRRIKWVALALLAGYLLFCHGCHGDEDNELFARDRNQAAMWNDAVP